MRSVHRFAAFFIVLFTLYMAITGSSIQLIDLKALLSHAPGTNPNIESIHESEDGPGYFAVIGPTDYDAAALPANFDFATSLGALLPSARNAAGASPFQYVEWRMKGSEPIAQVKIPGARLVLNPTGGQLLANVTDPLRQARPVQSAHDMMKNLHRPNILLGDWTFIVGMIVGTGLCLMIITGLVIWGKLYADRIRLGRFNPFWGSGSRWRQLHRSIALICSLFLLVIAFTGTWLEFDSFYRGIIVDQTIKAVGMAHAFDSDKKDYTSPLTNAELPGMLTTTLASFRRDHPDTPIKALRLRYFSGYAQGVVITGGIDTTQLVYNAHSGQSMSQTEPGYPSVYFPFGWQIHESLKRVHRGDYFGLTGRMMSLLSSFALIYLSISGIVMYLELWGKRRRAGRKAVLWN